MKIKNLLIGMMVATFITACGGDGDKESKEEVDKNTPEYIAEAYMKKLKQLDFKGAKKYTDKPTGQMLEALSGMTEMMPEEEKEKSKNTKILKVECEEPKDDKTQCTCSLQSGDKKDFEKVDLKKIDGDWKVHMEKDNM